LRVERAYQALIRRVKDGATPGSPDFMSVTAPLVPPLPQRGEHGGARRTHGLLALSTLGRLAVRRSLRDRAPSCVHQPDRSGYGVLVAGDYPSVGMPARTAAQVCSETTTPH
jgi:hypothetical protein